MKIRKIRQYYDIIAFEFPFLNVRTQSKPCRGITTQKSIPKLTTETGLPRGPRPQFEVKKFQKIRKSCRPAWKMRSRREIRPGKRIQARQTLQLKSQAKGDRRATKKVCRKNMLCCMLGCLGRCGCFVVLACLLAPAPIESYDNSEADH